ncbi:MAG: hypothetical protein KKF33_15970 [Alphaproteobacteria bacterium]|nr:hypothetical protein [Alphaproteobacteria bacterium]
MSWLRIPLWGGQVKVKPKYQMRWAERAGLVPKLNFGLFIISWWSRDALERDKRNQN